MFISDEVLMKTQVVESYEHQNKKFVVLEKTIFYPEGGGQNADTGTINGVKVLDVFKHQGKIIHEVETLVSGEVECILDEERRYQNSLMHTSQHLFCALIEKKGYEISSVITKEDYYYFDILDRIDRQELNDFENAANKLILVGIPVITRKYDEKEDQELDISHLDIAKEEINVVLIGGFDKEVCGGTHVDNTKELELIKVVDYKYMSNKTRVTVYLKEKARDYLQESFDEYYEIKKLINQNEVSTLEFITKKLKENKQLKKEVKTLEKKLKSLEEK